MPEVMPAFFSNRADTYDDHMRDTMGVDFDRYYLAVASALDPTERSVSLLDLGTGTGAELAAIMARLPCAHITCVDVSAAMLRKLSDRYHASAHRLTLVRGSYLGLHYRPGAYDYVVSVMTMHHLTCGAKLDLYRRLRQSLKPGGRYIEGDWVVSPAKAREYRELRAVRLLLVPPGAGEAEYHLDIPLTLEDQVGLLQSAGFDPVSVRLHEGERAVLAAGVAHPR